MKEPDEEMLRIELRNLEDHQAEVKGKIKNWNRTIVRNRGRINQIIEALKQLDYEKKSL